MRKDIGYSASGRSPDTEAFAVRRVGRILYLLRAHLDNEDWRSTRGIVLAREARHLLRYLPASTFRRLLGHTKRYAKKSREAPISRAEQEFGRLSAYLTATYGCGFTHRLIEKKGSVAGPHPEFVHEAKERDSQSGVAELNQLMTLIDEEKRRAKAKKEASSSFLRESTDALIEVAIASIHSRYPAPQPQMRLPKSILSKLEQVVGSRTIDHKKWAENAMNKTPGRDHQASPSLSAT